ncbi:type 1 glutamine amidotransferase domain-containing protein [Cetobacterium sp.]|uniref:type 1 glutamine amidotransferase domain-containing protein n=1 Tax=Cetobacterium sp. TaxID=2071632 RepID=UPI003F3A661B
MKKILFVLTSHGELGTTGKKTGIWLSELAEPYFTFKNRGIDITIVSLKGGDVPVDPMSLSESHKNPLAKIFLEDDMNLLKNTLSLDKIDFHQYDAIFYPGGHGPMWDLSESEENGKLVSDFFNNGKIVSAVCHGTAAFLKGINDRTGEPMIKNRNITGFSNSEEIAVGLQDIVPFLLETKIKELGGKYWKGDQNFSSYVVIDGPIFTGQNPASGILVAEKIIEELYS